MSPLAVAAPSAVTLSTETAPMISAEDLTKVYGVHRAIDRVSFTAGKGEILGFLGPNGAGKTTTMRILAGYTPATGGRASIAGFDVARSGMRAREKLGYLPESAPLYPSMTVRSYLRFMVELKRAPRGVRRRFVDHAIEECGLEEVADRINGNLSKGFRQRVGLAQAILGDPPVLILDEPTVGLDPRQVAGIRELIKEMAGRRTVLLSTHILSEVSAICSKVIVLDRGRVVAAGTPENLSSSLRTAAPIEVTVEGDADKARLAIGEADGVERVEFQRMVDLRCGLFHVHRSPGSDPRKDIARGVIAAGLGLVEMKSPGATLEDVFLGVISSPESD